MLSVIVRHELEFGAFRSARVADNLTAIERLPFAILDFTLADARAAAELRAALARAGTPIGDYDALIAAQALTRDLTLVTHNTREFARVADLRIEDWEAP